MPPGAAREKRVITEQGGPSIVIPSPPRADRGIRFSASRSDTAVAVAAWRWGLGGEINVYPRWRVCCGMVPCGRAVRTGPSTAGLRPSGRDDGEWGPVVGWHGHAKRGHGV